MPSFRIEGGAVRNPVKPLGAVGFCACPSTGISSSWRRCQPNDRLPIHPDQRGCADLGGIGQVLVTMDEIPGLVQLDVGQEGVEALVDVVVELMVTAG